MKVSFVTVVGSCRSVSEAVSFIELEYAQPHIEYSNERSSKNE